MMSLAASVVMQCLDIKARIAIQAVSWAENVFSNSVVVSFQILSAESSESSSGRDTTFP